MKIKSLFVAVLLMAGVVVVPSQGAVALDKPVVESFTVTPDDIDLTGTTANVTFELVVSHPNGIETVQTDLALTNSSTTSLSVTLKRIDSPINIKLTKVTFRGTLSLPREIPTGAYTFSAGAVKSVPIDNFTYSTGTILNPKTRTIVGAEYGLLVRNYGDINLTTPTFVGPAYDVSLGISFQDPIKFSSSNTPIWKVGETYNPVNYFEMRVPTLPLQVSTSTPKVCTTDGKLLTFVSEGNCSFNVFTAKTKEYPLNTKSLSGTIGAARTKANLIITKVENQTVKSYPQTVEVSRVFGGGGFILPVSATPTVCVGGSYFIKLISSGTCTLNYQSAAYDNFSASDVFAQTFKVLKEGETEVVPTPVATPTPTATPTPVATAAPVVKKTITCVKGTKSVKKTAISPKCPAGYKLKK